jgi:hypothetical protein
MRVISLLTADGDRPSCRPAAEKLFSETARTKTSISPARLSMTGLL